MLNNDSLYSKIRQIYENRRIAATDKAFLLTQKLNADKAFAENLEKLKNANFLRQKYEFSGDKVQAEKYSEEYERLKKERSEILKTEGVTEADLVAKYECKKCEDTGFLPGGGTCHCYFETLNAVINEQLGISKPDLPSFSDFKTQTALEEKVKTKLISYCEKFPELSVRNLVLTGNTGTGKTFAAGCIASAIEAKKHSVIFLTAVKANDLFLKYHTSDQADRKLVFSLLTDCDLLIIDDLGTEPVLRNVTVEYLTSILSERLANKNPFIITTNLTPEEMIKRYTERLVSRLSDSSTAIIPFNGKDKRRGI